MNYQNRPFVLPSQISTYFPACRNFRVLGTLDRLFQLKNLVSEMDQLPKEKDLFLEKVLKELGGLIDAAETLFGLLEYRGSYLLLNFELLAKQLSVVTGKRYFFLGEVLQTGSIFMMIPMVCSSAEDLDVFLYEKTVELMGNGVYEFGDERRTENKIGD